MRLTLPPALAEHQIAHILSRALPGHAPKIVRATERGLINVMYRLCVESLQEAFVLRVYARDPSACQKEVDLHQGRTRSMVDSRHSAPSCPAISA
jgi:hypothetical protein